MIVKVCGFRDPDEARHAAALGATHVGAVLWPDSKRAASEDEARAVFAAARSEGAVGVAVVVDDPDPAALAARVDADVVQLHGAETLQTAAALRAAGVPFWRALRGSWDAAALWTTAGAEQILLDAFVPGVPGGTGARVDDALLGAAPLPFVLAGGLTPANVAAAVALSPSIRGVDVASGVEAAPGRKDPALVASFLTAARAALRLETP